MGKVVRIMRVMLLLLLGFNIFLMAEPSNVLVPKRKKAVPKAKSTVATIVTKVPTATESKLLGTIDFRPGINLATGGFISENYAEFGYQFNKKFKLTYFQQFSNGSDTLGNFTAALNDGFARVRLDNLYSNKEIGFNFHYEGRIYAPTDSAKAADGFITSIRNYFALEKVLDKNFSLMIIETPIFYAYSPIGTFNGAPTTGKANPFFENRIYFAGLYSSDNGKVNIFAPIIWSERKYSDFQPQALNNDNWTDKIWFNPQITINVGSGINLGFEFESGNFINSNLEFDFLNAFATGIPKLILQFNL